ncbi:MAG: diadenylate cyclase [Planctomycetota bacterium]|nr:diadenylate cyclase [Planctomycetota bacterium]
MLDIVLLGLIIYQLLMLLRGTRAVQILVGLTLLVMLWLITGPGLLKLPALHRVLESLLTFIPFVVIILFQNQIRQALARVGRNPLAALLPRRQRADIPDTVALVAVSLAAKRAGALIVFEREMGLRNFTESGIRLDAIPSYDLLMNVFVKESPLHDGAVVISEGRVSAASCFLPLTTDPGLSRKYGTRHRAAIGITEESDAVAVVVSEERRTISFCEAGRIQEDLDGRRLKRLLDEAVTPKTEPSEAGRLASKWFQRKATHG